MEKTVVFEEPEHGGGIAWRHFTYKNDGKTYDGSVMVMSNIVGGMRVADSHEITWCEDAPADAPAAEREVLSVLLEAGCR